MGSLLALGVRELYAWIPNPSHTVTHDRTDRSMGDVSFSMGEVHQLTDSVIRGGGTFGTLCRNRSGGSRK